MRNQLRLAWAKIKTLSKITIAKRAGGMTQVIEHLPSKCKALSSKPQYCFLPQKTGSILANKAIFHMFYIIP
jgi:hypothetical protein